MFQNLLNWLDEGLPDDPLLIARVRLQHLSSLMMLLGGVVYTGVVLNTGDAWIAALLVPTMLTGTASLFLFTRRGQHETGGKLTSWTLLLFVTLCVLARGGMDSNSAVWFLVVPTQAFMAVGFQHGARVTMATFLAQGGLWLLERMAGDAFPMGLSAQLKLAMELVDYPLVTGMLALAFVVYGDIWRTVIRRLETEVIERQRAENEAKAAAQARYTFLATMSHEIRTPLNGVLGLTEVLLQTPLDEEQDELARTVRSSGKLLRTLLDDVLDFSKIDSGHMSLMYEPLSPRRLCGELVQLWQGPASESGLELRLEMDPQVPEWVLGDTTRLGQILGNLLSNAIKFTAKGSVLIRGERVQQTLVLSVQDTGIGMPAEALERVFDAFQQADGTTTRSFGGTGLGLAISRRLAQLMGGDLRAESVQGRGSTFTLTLPLRPTSAPSVLPENAPESDNLQGLRVLVAEDNKVNQLVVRRLLEREGVEVVVAEDGAEAVAIWQRNQPDLLLMDCQMPKMDGFEATRMIRSLGGTLPILALTANSMPGDRANCIQAGMNDHVSKPIDPDTLLAAMRSHLPKRRIA